MAWHARFLERYGSGAVIPIRQVVDVGTGLGYPVLVRATLVSAST
ncbi:MAG: lantibiotic dehydratase [Pseudonocardiaceae bacterium]